MSDLHSNAMPGRGPSGDIQGAFGTIQQSDTRPRVGILAKLKTLCAIVGPGLIVMVGDNDAGAFSTYAQAGQNYGTSLLWVLALLIPVLYVNQEMVLRLGAVTGVGHARLILERFGKFWGAFSVIDLFVLNSLTIVTEFIGISLGLDYLGIPKLAGIVIAAVLIILAASTGDFRRFERFSMVLIAGSLVLIPLFVLVHPEPGKMLHDFLVPQLPLHAPLSQVLLLIVGIVGTTIAPWQLFFQQSYVIDKRITPRFINYERVDLWLGIILVILGAIAIMACTAQAFEGTAESGKFLDTAAVATGIGKGHGRLAGAMFAIALIDASIIGAGAIALSSAYAIGDVLSVSHSLHRQPAEARGFYGIYCTLIVASAALVLVPGMPLGLLTNAVQAMAGILLPSAAIFLLLLCNDKQVMGPWVNTRLTNAVTLFIVGILVILSLVLTAAVLFPDLTAQRYAEIALAAGTVMTITGIVALLLRDRRLDSVGKLPTSPSRVERDNWRMPSLKDLTPYAMGSSTKMAMAILRAYLITALCIVVYKGIVAMTGCCAS